MKRTCLGCRALNDSRENLSCDLGFKLQIKDDRGFAYNAKPLEECPKPITVKELVIQEKIRFEKMKL